MERRLNFFRFLLISYLLIYQDTIEAVVFKMTNAVCLSYNDSVFIFHHCRLKAISRNKVVLNLNGTLPHPVDKISFHLKVFKRENGYKPWLIDSKTDICRFLKSNYDPVAKIVFNLFKEFSNLNHPCPFVGLQYVMGFYPRPELLILPFPSGDYMLMIRWFLNNKLTFDTNVSFIFTEDLLA
ncbi:uncharacterized protein LOC123258393 [Drosophila ananassae]|uniref:uncharacterized protein LOC123258393 n=1 Tax=Drosophila ananassae TaxID=7217 RepID=UPI001CFFA9A7|nr:uncharacterized protein LOC123258393 [Drosophila ananassae]